MYGGTRMWDFHLGITVKTRRLKSRLNIRHRESRVLQTYIERGHTLVDSFTGGHRNFLLTPLLYHVLCDIYVLWRPWCVGDVSYPRSSLLTDFRSLSRSVPLKIVQSVTVIGRDGKKGTLTFKVVQGKKSKKHVRKYSPFLCLLTV